MPFANTVHRLFVVALLTLGSGTAAASPYTVIDLGTLGRPGSQANAINGSGVIVGGATINNGQSHAFVYQGASMSDLGIRGSLSTAQAINNTGQIAGYYYSSSYQAFLDTGGKIKDLGTLGGNYA
ncbi:MAG: HAF repeat-containing protein, partial [Candidatus Eisenbacteria bacterium]